MIHVIYESQNIYDSVVGESPIPEGDRQDQPAPQSPLKYAAAAHPLITVRNNKVKRLKAATGSLESVNSMGISSRDIFRASDSEIMAMNRLREAIMVETKSWDIGRLLSITDQVNEAAFRIFDRERSGVELVNVRS